VTHSRAGTENRFNVLVLGLGNVLLGDDGVGPLALARLERDYRVPPPVRLAEGGTLGLALLDEIAGARHLILVDAVATEEQPGTLVRLDGEAVMDAVRDRLSVHQVGVADLLDAARLIGRYPDSVVLLGIVPGRIGLSVTRTHAVDAALPALVAAVVEEVRAHGHELDPLDSQESPAAPDRPIHALVRHFGL
jgi:hydrogenase maturation protease